MRKKREENYKEIYKKQQKRFKNLSQESFFIAGLMLYSGEGDKKNKNRINLANTDPLIVKFFIKWLNDFLSVKKEKIKIQLHLYENMDIEEEKNFWINELKVKKAQLYKPSIRKLQKASFSYKESFRHGTCSIYVCNTKKKMEIMAAIQSFFDLYFLGT